MLAIVNLMWCSEQTCIVIHQVSHLPPVRLLAPYIIRVVPDLIRHVQAGAQKSFTVSEGSVLSKRLIRSHHAVCTRRCFDCTNGTPPWCIVSHIAHSGAVW